MAMANPINKTILLNFAYPISYLEVLAFRPGQHRQNLLVVLYHQSGQQGTEVEDCSCVIPEENKQRTNSFKQSCDLGNDSPVRFHLHKGVVLPTKGLAS